MTNIKIKNINVKKYFYYYQKKHNFLNVELKTKNDLIKKENINTFNTYINIIKINVINVIINRMFLIITVKKQEQIKSSIEIDESINYKIYYLHTKLVFRNVKSLTQFYDNST